MFRFLSRNFHLGEGEAQASSSPYVYTIYRSYEGKNILNTNCSDAVYISSCT